MAHRRVFLTIAAIVTVLVIIPAVAAGTKVSVDIQGGPLSLTAGNPTLADTNLTGSDQITTGTLGLIEVTDARGTGAGWNVTAQATDFIKPADPSQKIPAAGLIVEDIPPATTVAGNAAPSGATGSLGSPLLILTAETDSGMGRYQATPQISLLVPAETLAGSYDSTLTLTITSGQ